MTDTARELTAPTDPLDDDTPLYLPPLSPWERLPTETPEAWDAFTHYRDMGPSRSLAKVGRTCGKSTSLMEQWSVKHGWVARVEAWDDELDRERRAEHIVAVREMSGEHVKVGNALIAKAMQALESCEAKDMTPHQIARFMRDGVTIVRMALGQATATDPANGETDETVENLTDAMRQWFEQAQEREQEAFLEGAAAASEVAADQEPVPDA
jgi:hypothetical protein